MKPRDLKKTGTRVDRCQEGTARCGGRATFSENFFSHFPALSPTNEVNHQ
jgi:hypothetical protein